MPFKEYRDVYALWNYVKCFVLKVQYTILIYSEMKIVLQNVAVHNALVHGVSFVCAEFHKEMTYTEITTQFLDSPLFKVV